MSTVSSLFSLFYLQPLARVRNVKKNKNKKGIHSEMTFKGVSTLVFLYALHTHTQVFRVNKMDQTSAQV